MSNNYTNFANWIPLIYPKEPEIQETTEITSSASFCGHYLNIDTNGQLST